MSANQSASLLHHLRKTKAALFAASFTLAGILLMMLNAWLSPLQLGDWQWLHVLPLGELGGTLFGAGLLSTFFEYAFRRDQERTVTERFRHTIREEAPALRDAVIESFRFDGQDAARIATSELLDDLACTSLGLRLQRARIAKGPSQEALVHVASISTYTYQKFEKGEPRPGTPMNPRLRTLIALAAVLDMRVEELVGELSEQVAGGVAAAPRSLR